MWPNPLNFCFTDDEKRGSDARKIKKPSDSGNIPDDDGGGGDNNRDNRSKEQDRAPGDQSFKVAKSSKHAKDMVSNCRQIHKFLAQV